MKLTLSTITLIISSIFFIFEIIGGINEGESFMHWYTEAFIFLLLMCNFAYEIHQSKKLKNSLVESEHKLISLKNEIADSIKAQFQVWELSSTEVEIAWLIIKGFSFNEISSFRSVTEKTVRKQAAKIYKKADVTNRSEFTASFLEDLMIKGSDSQKLA